MLSIMIFKNMYPEEFALLQGTEGIIKKHIVIKVIS